MNRDREIAKQVLKYVGDDKNINSVVHCATRLRFQLKDNQLAQTEELKKVKGVIQVVINSGQYQVVIGNNVQDVFKELNSMINIENDSSEKEKKKFSLTDIISSIFTPFLSVIAGAGLMKGLLQILLITGVLSEFTGTYVILNAAADGFFVFLPVAIAYSAAKKFDTNPFLAVALAAALLYPGLAQTMELTNLRGEVMNVIDLNFLGIPVIYGAGYGSSVFPIILGVIVQSYVERFFKKIMPRIIKIFAVTLCTLLVMVPLTFIVLGPLGTVIGSILAGIFTRIYEFNAVIAGVIIGGFWQVAVIFGMHWGFVPIALENLGTQGYDFLIPMAIAAVIAQAGSSLAIAITNKDKEMKGLAASGTITALFGITEPTVYGVTLPLKRPFYAALIGGAIGAVMMAVFKVKTFAWGVSMLSIPNFMGRNGVESSALLGALSLAVAFVSSFILTIVIQKKNQGKEVEGLEKESTTEVEESPEATAKMEQAEELVISPLNGEVIALKDVADEVFSSGAMGDGVAVLPSIGELYAPIDGEISVLFPTGHAVGMVSAQGTEILMHIGMDTVELDGKGFEPQVAQGDTVKKGDLLVKFDMEAISAAGKPLVTPIVVTNTDEKGEIVVVAKNTIAHGEDLLKVL